MPEQPRILVAGGDQDTAMLLTLMLQQDDGLAVVGHAKGWQELGAALTELKPTVVILDLDAPGEGMATAIGFAKAQGCPVAFAGLAGRDDSNGALLAVLDGIILKSDPLDRMPASLRVIHERGAKNRAQGAATVPPPPQSSTAAPEYQPPAAQPPMPSSIDCEPDESIGHNGASETLQEAVFNSVPIPSPAPPPASSPMYSRSEIPAFEATPETFAVDMPQAPGSTNVIVSSFTSFRSLGAFQGALERLEGVHSIGVRRFHKGILYVVVNYEGTVPLEQRLVELAQFAPRVVSRSPGTIELQVEVALERSVPLPRNPR